MSLELVQTRFLGVLPFPVPMESLNGILSFQPNCIAEHSLDAVCRAMAGYAGSYRAKTEDDYEWFRILRFKNAGATIHVAIPWTQDWKRADRSQMDRSAAVYVEGQVTGDYVLTLVLALTVKFINGLISQTTGVPEEPAAYTVH